MQVDIAMVLAPWGKARPAGLDHLSSHPVLYHGLDVAACGERLLDLHAGHVARLAMRLGWEPEALRRATLFLLALHDVGKLARPFQAKQRDLWPAAYGPFELACVDPGHGASGLWLLGELIPDALSIVLHNWRRAERQRLLAPFLGHHGKPVSVPTSVQDWQVFGPAVLDIARAHVEIARVLFSPPALPPPERAEPLETVGWWLAGLAVLADWLGSTQRFADGVPGFLYEAPIWEPAAYLAQIARPRAGSVLAHAGLVSAAAAAKGGLARIAGAAWAASPVQAWAEMVELPPGPLCVLIEDMTGGGKTEAALVLAHRLIASGRAGGLFLALPTMATANAMHARLAEVYRRLFAPEAAPWLALAHGRSELHAGFRASVVASNPSLEAGRPIAEVEPGEEVGDASAAACAAWLADERRKAFLAHVGVGTIDQALLAVLPVRFQSLRLFGLADRVLIVDEAHAYDAYMNEELERILTFQAALGGSAIVLSATLPQSTRARLAAAFARGLGTKAPGLEGASYPRVTLVAEGGASERAHRHRPGLERSLTVERLPDAEAAIAAIEAVVGHAAVAWVRNSVDDAIDAAAALRAAGHEVVLFHARMAMGDRQAVESDVIGRWGKHGVPGKRRGILVATQVIEQSLDLDFDLMISDLAPVDLLLQRAGRLWRHLAERPAVARPVPGPRLLVVSPDPAGTVATDWFEAAFPRAAWVYRAHAVLWLTAKELFGRGTVRVPEDVRALVEAVYGPGLVEAAAEATGLARNADEALAADMAATSLARANLLKLHAGGGNIPGGYGGEHAGWTDETRTPTRLGEEQTVLRLARIETERVVPWCADPDPRRAWALSELSVRRSRIVDAPEPTGPHARAVAEAKAGWTRFDAEKPLLLLTPGEGERWQGRGIDAKGAAVPISYMRREGLRFET